MSRQQQWRTKTKTGPSARGFSPHNPCCGFPKHNNSWTTSDCGHPCRWTPQWQEPCPAPGQWPLYSKAYSSWEVLEFDGADEFLCIVFIRTATLVSWYIPVLIKTSDWCVAREWILHHPSRIWVSYNSDFWRTMGWTHRYHVYQWYIFVCLE